MKPFITRTALEHPRRATIGQFKGALFGILAETAVAAAIPQLLQGITAKKV